MPTRVLIVDDVAEIRSRIREALDARSGFAVVGEAASGAEAIALAGSLQPDVVVLETGMPDLAGQQVLSKLRADVPAVKVVVFSGAVPDAAAEIDGYVAKADQLDYLVDLLVMFGEPDRPRASIDLPHDLDSPRIGRSFCRRTLESWEVADVVDDTLLVVSELVSNAVRHGRTGCELRLLLGALAVRIEVCDRGEGTPDPLPPSEDRPFGRGLNLIDALTSAWGVEPLPDRGKVVWAELPRVRTLA